MTAHSQPALDFSMLDESVLMALQYAGATRFHDPRVDMMIAPQFLTFPECAIFTAMIEADCAPSRMAYEGADPTHRTSETCYFHEDLPIVGLLETRLAIFLGLAPDHGERIQGQRYLEGQQFKAHGDFFHSDRDDYEQHCGASGNRTWTAMIYLNEPGEGGETYFHHLRHGFSPETGTLLAWNNLRPDGRPNPMTMHQGMPVISGAKYILTKWYRERPFQNPTV